MCLRLTSRVSMFFFFFFFSSRRRHTRCSRDWSSDVCSSDLILGTNSADPPLKGLRYLLEAAAAIRKMRKLMVVVIGKPKENGDIDRLVGELGLGDTVRFTGRIGPEE